VDSAEGPQAQTRFVLRKALEAGAKPIVVINKIDRENANPKKVLDQVFELFMSLNATDEQLDFPFIYCSAKEGYAKTELEHVTGTMEPLFDAIVKFIPPPRAKAGDGFQLLVANLDYSDYLGRIAFGKIYEGKIKVGDPAICRHGNGVLAKGKITMLYHFEGMKRIEIQEAHAGDIVGVTGFEDVFIGETITDSEARAALPYIPIDPPTIQMEFAVNDGPLAGQDGKLVTARHIWDRLVKEIRTTSPCASRRPATRKYSPSAAVAKCRSPFSWNRCAAKATKSWYRARKCFGKRTPPAIRWSRLKNCSSKCRAKTSARSWKIFPAARRRSRT
jgi:GTP-binding protein